MTVQITTPVGRLVSGHPMVANPVTDKKGVQKMQKDGITPQIDFYVGLAIQKGAETDWKQTEWGQLIQQEAIASWPNGEHMQPTFAWKIIDGDSPIPNKKGKIPNQREGWPGHWIINASNGFPISCFPRGKYNPLHDQLANKAEIKRGDYARLVIDVKGNNPSESPGVYINPSLFELYQPGVEIISENAPDAAAAFGAVQGVLPQGAQIDTNVPTPGQVVPATDFVTPPLPGQGAATPPPPPPAPTDYNVSVQGVTYSAAALKAQGWTEDQINANPRV